MGCLHARQPYPIGRATISRRKVELGTPEEGWWNQMQMQGRGMQVCQGRLLMQLLMQITTALYLAITLSSFDASSLFQTWQNQRERGERELRYIQPPKIPRQAFGLLLDNVKKQPIPLGLSVRKCDCDREVGSGSKWVLRLWSEWRHLDHVWPHGGEWEADVDRQEKTTYMFRMYHILCILAVLVDQGQNQK